MIAVGSFVRCPAVIEGCAARGYGVSGCEARDRAPGMRGVVTQRERGHGEYFKVVGVVDGYEHEAWFDADELTELEIP